METQYCNTLSQDKTCASNLRINAVDLARGFIMIMMAFCHSRDYIGPEAYENLSWNSNTIWQGALGIDILYQLFSLIAPGGFFMLMGISIVYFYHSRLKSGWSSEKTMRFLIVRGLLLIVLQFTILQAFEIVAENTLYFYMGVLFALGCGMLVAACVENLSCRIRSPFILPILVILAITIPQQFYINHLQNQHIEASLWQVLLLLGGDLDYGIVYSINFTPLPWIPGVMMGLVIGHLMLKYKQNNMPIIGKMALIFLGLLTFLSLLNLLMGIKIGDYRAYDTLTRPTVLSWFCISKYPPSINYYLFACGINLGLIYILSLCERSRTFCTLLSPVKTIGQCALFFYVLHWFVYYGLSLITPTQQFSEWQVLATWLSGVLILYPLCKLYLRFKQTRPPESIWRLF